MVDEVEVHRTQAEVGQGRRKWRASFRGKFEPLVLQTAARATSRRSPNFGPGGKRFAAAMARLAYGNGSRGRARLLPSFPFRIEDRLSGKLRPSRRGQYSNCSPCSCSTPANEDLATCRILRDATSSRSRSRAAATGMVPRSPSRRSRRATASCFGLLRTDDEHVGDQVELRIANLRPALSNCGYRWPRGSRPRETAVRLPARSRGDLSERGSTRTCSGASQSGNAPAKCSMRTPTNRSIDPNGAR